MTHTFRIPHEQPPTLNSLMRGKIKDRIRLSRDWETAITLACRGSGIPEATTKRRVTITVVLGYRQRGADPDAYFKAVGDGLVRCGRLKGDSRRHVEWMPVQYERGEWNGKTFVKETRIRLEDLP